VSDTQLTITDSDLLFDLRQQVQKQEAAIVVLEAMIKYVQYMPDDVDGKDSLPDEEQIASFYRSVATAKRVVQVLEHVLEGKDLPPGAAETTPSWFEVIHPEAKPAKSGLNGLDLFRSFMQ
jgi:hypothetical protein